MSRYLFVVPPLDGHVNPAVGVAAELERRGHDVAWVAHGSVVGRLLGEHSVVYPAGDRFLDEVVGHLPERSRLRGPASLQFLWERVLLPLARDMVDPAGRAIVDFRPDVVVSDQQAFAGALAAARHDLPWAVSATTSADLADPLTLVPKVARWMDDRIADLCRAVGAPDPAEHGFDPRTSPHLIIRYSTPRLVGVDEDGPDGWSGQVFVGPVLPARAREPFPEEWFARHDVNVLVSLGTVSHDIGERFLRTVLEAVDGRPYGVVMVARPDLVSTPPANVLLRPFVPQLDLLPRMDAVVCHAGHNTTVEALSFGVPLVCAPIRDDQPVTAGQVVQAGAGVRISFARARSEQVASAVDAVLHDPSYRAAAEEVAWSFREAGGAATAADHLVKLARR